MLRGVYTAIITPFHADGGLDLEALGALIERQIDAEVAGVVPCGTTGEASTLSAAEQAAVIEATVRAVRGRVQVIAGVGGNNTQEVIERARAAQALGVDGLLVVTPYYNKPSQEGLFAHYQAIAGAVAGLPLVLYNVPSRTGISLSAQTIARLAAVPGVVAIKEASADLIFAGEIFHQLRAPLAVLSGDDFTALPLWSLGGVGVISVASNLWPAQMVALWRAFEAGRLDEAQAIQRRLFPLFRALFVETNPVPVKSLVAWHTGLCAAQVRLPLVGLQPESVAHLQGVCADLEIDLPHGPRP